MNKFLRKPISLFASLSLSVSLSESLSLSLWGTTSRVSLSYVKHWTHVNPLSMECSYEWLFGVYFNGEEKREKIVSKRKYFWETTFQTTLRSQTSAHSHTITLNGIPTFLSNYVRFWLQSRQIAPTLRGKQFNRLTLIV